MRLRPYTTGASTFLRAAIGPLPMPVRVNWAVTHRCNGRCLTCNIWRSAEHRELDTETFVRFFAANRHLVCLSLTGGEVFLRTDVVEIVAAALASCPGLSLINITTNGLLTERIVSDVGRILDLKPHALCVVVSIDGPRSIHDTIRGSPGAYDRSVETFRRLRLLKHPKLDLYAGMTVSGHNLGHIEACFAGLQQEIPGFAADEFNMNLAHVSAHYYRNLGFDLSFAAAAAKEVLAFFSAHAHGWDTRNLIERVYHRHTAKFVATGHCPIRCRAADISCYVDPEGHVFPCHIDDECLGSLDEHAFSLARLGQSPRFRAARKRVRAGRCAQCWTPCGAYDSLLSQPWRFFA
jgi:MoaA/NifB/PqqE/SkfB family radical SAM enzyme